MKRSLNRTQRGLFDAVDRIIKSNPFGDERDTADEALQRLGGGRDGVVVVAQRLDALRTAGAHRCGDYGTEDAYRLQTAVLYHVFHRSAPLFDAFIERQHARGDDCCPVDFAETTIDELLTFGMPEADAVRFFELFYQLRRAYYFITRWLRGPSPCMRALRCRLWENVFTTDVRLYDRYLWRRMEDFSTLLLGETGTGKGTAAAAIGHAGFIPYNRRRGCFEQSFTEAFVAITLSEFPENLIESELFGHRRGAFTGAVDHHQGVLERCSPHGAVLLDEIGEVTPSLQVKLLKLLQTRVFSPVGSHERRRFEGRVIAATNQPIEQRRREGAFRDDFYYRLCSDRIEIPPLRQRLAEDPGELRVLVDGMLARLCGEGGHELVDACCDAIRTGVGDAYAWRGNVRELEQAVRRVLLRGAYRPPAAERGERIDDDYVSRVLGGALTAQELIAGYCARLYAESGSYGAVARRTGLDWRTVKKHVSAGAQQRFPAARNPSESASPLE